jgi:hypothetical protein
MSVVSKQANVYLNPPRKRIPSLQEDIEMHEAMITNGMVKFLYPEQPENEFTRNFAYEKWLRDNFPKPTENELNKMEVTFSKPLIPINTLNYQPWQGA